jgi:transmembrane sensor
MTGRWRTALLMTSVVLATFTAAGLALHTYSERSGWSSISTAIGNYRRMPLSDGSTLELNTASEVLFRFSAKLRELHLAAGEARFRVAPEASRPFVVTAGDTVIRAVGTEFTVRLRENGKVDVLVSDGVVAVSHRVHQSALREWIYGSAVPLRGGRQVPEKTMLVDDGGRFSEVEVTRAKIEAHDAWRTNMLEFNDEPLSEIVEEFNRFNRQKLEIGDAAIGSVRVNGRYRPRDVDGFLQKLSTVADIHVSLDEEREGVVRRIYSAEPAERLAQ